MPYILVAFVLLIILYAVFHRIMWLREVASVQQATNVHLENQLRITREELEKTRDRGPGLEHEDPNNAPWASVRTLQIRRGIR